MIILLTFILIYILSCIAMYWYVRLAVYHSRGIFHGMPVNIGDYFMTFFPVVNTIAAIVFYLDELPVTSLKLKTKKPKSTNNIFKPKDYEKNK